MSIAKNQIISVLSPPLPQDIVTRLLDEYQDIKQQLFFRKFRPSELNGGRFAECALRLIQYLDNPPYTPFGTSLYNTNNIISRVESNTSLHESIRFYIPRLLRILLDVRNRRDVAHVGGDVSPNYSDSLLISNITDWILTEIIRIYFNCSIDSARKIIENINEVRVPIIADVDGFVRVQNTSLNFRDKTLAILYYKNPEKVKDSLLCKWTKYSNLSAYRRNIIVKLDAEAIIHYDQDRFCTLLPKGIVYIEKHIPMEIIL
jgi:hypothetical protein